MSAIRSAARPAYQQCGPDVAHMVSCDDAAPSRATDRSWQLTRPSRPGTPHAASPGIAVGDELAAAGKGDLVLLVDDDRDIREVTAAILTTAGYSVQTACNGREALDLLRSMRPSLILLDFNMPMLDGAAFREHQRR